MKIKIQNIIIPKKFDFFKTADGFLFLVRADQEAEELRKAGSKVKDLLSEEVEELFVDGPKEDVFNFTEGLLLASYQFLKYRSTKEKEALRIEREKEIEDKRKQEEERQRLELIKAKAVVTAPKQVGKIDLDTKPVVAETPKISPVKKEEKPVEFRKVEIGGTISSNLYVNMTEIGIGPDLIDQFADLYGWAVDFQRLQKGDKFKVSYSEKVVEGTVIGIGDIEVAYFEHMGVPYHAIPFEQNGERTFFDQDGNSFKKAFLRDPLKYSRISSRYNLNRFHPVQKRYKAHLGTDYAAPTGTEIRSVGDGTVVEARYTSANGNFVKIKHNGTYTTQYLHMSKIAKGMKSGERVKQGQVIGYVGSTGLATGPHLCFRFWKNGKQEDWLKEKIPPSEPISQENRMAFEQVKMEKMRQIAAIPYIDANQKLVAKVNP